jgi:hypothetical protein
MWHLSLTKWHWNRIFYSYFSFPLSVSFHHCSILIHSSLTNANNLINWQHFEITNLKTDYYLFTPVLAGSSEASPFLVSADVQIFEMSDNQPPWNRNAPNKLEMKLRCPFLASIQYLQYPTTVQEQRKFSYQLFTPAQNCFLTLVLSFFLKVSKDTSKTNSPEKRTKCFLYWKINLFIYSEV